MADEGKLSSLFVEQLATTAAEGRLSSLFVEQIATTAAEGRCGSLFAEVFLTVGGGSSSSFYGLWPQEMLNVMPFIQGQQLQPRRGQM